MIGTKELISWLQDKTTEDRESIATPAFREVFMPDALDVKVGSKELDDALIKVECLETEIRVLLAKHDKVCHAAQISRSEIKSQKMPTMRRMKKLLFDSAWVIASSKGEPKTEAELTRRYLDGLDRAGVKVREATVKRYLREGSNARFKPKAVASQER